MLEAAGHHVTSRDRDPVPAGFSVEPDFVIGDGTVDHSGESLDSAEAAHIARVLARCGGNRRQTALSLGIARSTLLAKIRKYQL